jgi:hypothetical protein
MKQCCQADLLRTPASEETITALQTEITLLDAIYSVS